MSFHREHIAKAIECAAHSDQAHQSQTVADAAAEASIDWLRRAGYLTEQRAEMIPYDDVALYPDDLSPWLKVPPVKVTMFGKLQNGMCRQRKHAWFFALLGLPVAYELHWTETDEPPYTYVTPYRKGRYVVDKTRPVYSRRGYHWKRGIPRRFPKEVRRER